jgi:hypothetical protein
MDIPLEDLADNPRLLTDWMKQARDRLYRATAEMDEIWRQRRALTNEELLAALQPYTSAAMTLLVRHAIPVLPPRGRLSLDCQQK